MLHISVKLLLSASESIAVQELAAQTYSEKDNNEISKSLVKKVHKIKKKIKQHNKKSLPLVRICGSLMTDDTGRGRG